MAASKGKIEKNLQQIRENIAEACRRAGRSPGEVSIIAVTKTADLEAIKAAVDLGLLDLGESRAQQLVERAGELNAHLQRRRTELPGSVRWHMIGHLQRNKIRLVMDVAEVIHSVDSLRLAEAINDRAEKAGKPAEVLLQVNCSEEPQKFGVAVAAALHMAELMRTLKHLRLLGLMTMAEQTSQGEQTRPTFVRCRELFEEIRKAGVAGDSFRHVSMGMSQDYAVAVEEGATLLRIGSALFE